VSDEIIDEVLDLKSADELLKPFPPEEILAFWFWGLGLQSRFVGGMATLGVRERWFRSDGSFDLEIRQRFVGGGLEGAALVRRELFPSDQPPLLRRGLASGVATLARIVVFGHFPRNLFRGLGSMLPPTPGP